MGLPFEVVRTKPVWTTLQARRQCNKLSVDMSSNPENPAGAASRGRFEQEKTEETEMTLSSLFSPVRFFGCDNPTPPSEELPGLLCGIFVPRSPRFERDLQDVLVVFQKGQGL
jgi:hypothetical protein